MDKLHFEHLMVEAPDILEMCPRCKSCPVFRPQPGVAYCYRCGGVDGSDVGIFYRKLTPDELKESIGRHNHPAARAGSSGEEVHSTPG